MATFTSIKVQLKKKENQKKDVVVNFWIKKKEGCGVLSFSCLYTWQHTVSRSANDMTWQKAQSKSRIPTLSFIC